MTGGEGGIDSGLRPDPVKRALAHYVRCASSRPTVSASARTRCLRLCNPTPQEMQKGPQGPFLYFWRRGWDSNPRYAKSAHLISSQARSTTPAPLRML